MSRKSYKLLKLESVDTNKCIRVGCSAAPADDSLLCPECRDDHRDRQNRSARRRRRYRRAQVDWLDCLRAGLKS